MITSTKLYVPAVTSSISDNIIFLENLKQGFKRTISWNKIKIGNNNTTKKQNLNYMIDETFRSNNKLLVRTFKVSDNDATRNYFVMYYMSLVKIKHFNALIDKKPFFDQPVINKQEGYEKPVEMPNIKN